MVKAKFHMTALPALALIAGAGSAQAPQITSGAFTVAPLRLEVAASSDSANLQLTNALDRTSSVQVRIFAWRQENGVDRFSPSDDFVVSPSIFKIAPQSIQLVHIVRQRPTGPGESRYRVVIDQLPEAGGSAGPTATTRLQMTLPLFVGSETAAPAKIEMRIRGKRLEVSNSGGRTARIGALALVAPDGTRWPIPLDSGRYVMGQSTVNYAIPGFVCQATPSVRLTGTIDRITINAVPNQTCL